MLRRYWRALAFGLLIGLVGLFFWHFQFDPITRGVDIDRAATIRLFLQLRGDRPPPDDLIVIDLARSFDDVRQDRQVGPALAARPEWAPCLRDSLGQPTPETRWPRCAVAGLLDQLIALGAAQVVFDIFFDQAWPGDEALEAAIARAGNVVLQEWCEDPVTRSLPRQSIRLPRNSSIPMTEGCGPALDQPLERLRSVSGGSGPMLLLFREGVVTRNWSFAPRETGLRPPPGTTTLPPMMPMVALQAGALPLLDLIETQARTCAASYSSSLRPSRDRAREILERMGAVRATLSARPDIERCILAELDRRSPEAISATDPSAVRALLRGYVAADPYYINYYGPTGTLPYTSVEDVLQGTASPARFKGSTVFIGSTINGDAYPTPYTETLADNIAGVELTATTFANLRARETIAALPEPWASVLIMATGLLFGILGRIFRPANALLTASGAAVGYFGATYVEFIQALVLLPLMTPLVGQALPALVFGALLRTLGPRSRTFEGVCLETDIKGSMDLARRPRFKAELRRYFHDVGAIISRHSGTLIRAGDDSTMSYWREGSSRTAARESACLAALELTRRFGPDGDLERGQFPTRIGVHAGPLVVSGLSVGEARVANLTGDVANTAARLQELCKALGTWVLASATVTKGVPGFETRRIGRFLLIGRDEPIDVVELIGQAGQVKPERLAARDAFVTAMGFIERSDRGTGEACLATLLDQYPGDQAARFFLAVLRGESSIARLDGDGVIRMTTK